MLRTMFSLTIADMAYGQTAFEAASVKPVIDGKAIEGQRGVSFGARAFARIGRGRQDPRSRRVLEHGLRALFDGPTCGVSIAPTFGRSGTSIASSSSIAI